MKPSGWFGTSSSTASRIDGETIGKEISVDISFEPKYVVVLK
jgi:hypothetical protein